MTYNEVELPRPCTLSQVILHPTIRTIVVTTANKEEITNIAISTGKVIQLLK